MQRKMVESIVVYARVSSRTQKESLDRQLSRLEGYCIAKGYQIGKILAETETGEQACDVSNNT